MTIRIVRAVSLTLLVSSACALADATDAPSSTDDAKPPVTVEVESLVVADAGSTKGEPRGRFGIVNLEQGTCYAFAPPGGPTVEIGESYTVIPASGVDDAVRAKLAADYPKCAAVDVVGRALH